MQYRKLGKTNIEVSEIGFGAWGIGGGWGTLDDEEALHALQLAVDLGVNFIDTALVYGDGHSEQLIGQAIQGKREEIVLATKVPPKNFIWPVDDRTPLSETFPAHWIIECTERSLKNLATDSIDILQLHGWTPVYLEQMEWLEAGSRLKQQGKIRALGVCANDWDAYGPISLIKSGLIDSVQITYNIFEQRPDEKLLPQALEGGVGIIARIPFEEGLLTGQFRPGHVFPPGDWRAAWLTPERLHEAAIRTQALQPFLSDDKPSLAALALKFCLSNPAVCTTIPGMRTKRHVQANCAVSDGMLLSAVEREALKLHAFAHGWSYPGGAGVSKE